MRASVATNVTVDLEGLDCTVCFGPLKPPVFQCASGHVLCSICYEKLPEKENCQVCSINTGYNRCFAMERVLQSIQVLCSNARNGCTARMPYHEMEEHEKECPKAVCGLPGSKAMQPMPMIQGLLTDCYTLVIPKVSPSTSINIIINNGETEKKIHDNKSSTDSVVKMDPEALDCPSCLPSLVPLVHQSTAGQVVCSSCHNKCASCFSKTGYTCCHGVERTLQSMCLACPNAIQRRTGSGNITGKIVKMGPCGGGGGEAWEMDMDGVDRVVKLRLWHDFMVDAMMVLYELDDGSPHIKLWGCPQAANCSEISLETDEYLTGVKGHVGDCKGWLRLRSLTLISNRRTFGPYGTEEGAPFELPAAGGRIIGFHGRSGTFLDALGIYVKMDA